MSRVNHIPLKRVMSENSGLCYLEFLVISARWFVVWLIASQFSGPRLQLLWATTKYGASSICASLLPLRANRSPFQHEAEHT